ncbi:hypothetical protein [Nitrosomonas sp. Nm34]|uniref:hypothetical protein n=1 Tax=Nitrosomonas sp. Nm34 TaxID=1881055 RepID=UPI001587E7D0|nr:hypothetical protein [Nitrosomonas sp. Nm34]
MTKQSVSRSNTIEILLKPANNIPPPWQWLKNQINWGDDDFVNNMQRKLNPEQSLKDIPRKQKQAPVKPLSDFVDRYKKS